MNQMKCCRYRDLSPAMRRSLCGMLEEVTATQCYIREEIASVVAGKKGHSSGTSVALTELAKSCDGLAYRIKHQFPECRYDDCPDGLPEKSSELRRSLKDIQNHVALVLGVLPLVVQGGVRDELQRIRG